MNPHNKKTCSKRRGNNEKNSVQVIEQREQSQNSSKIEDILNHPVLKRRLPPIERKQNEEEKAGNEVNNNNIDMNLEDLINNNIQQLNKEKEPEVKDNIKDSLELDLNKENKEEIKEKNIVDTVDNAEKEKENIIEEKITNEIGTGTPYYCENIQDLKNEVDNKTKIISKLSEEQNNYKFKLNELFQKLNKLLAENVELLYNEEDDEDSKKLENLNELKLQLEKRIKGINSSKNQNKIYKKQYDILATKDKNTKNENIEKK